jgi:hypothetical protein
VLIAALYIGMALRDAGIFCNFSGEFGSEWPKITEHSEIV